jgi:hypothetical protein
MRAEAKNGRRFSGQVVQKDVSFAGFFGSIYERQHDLSKEREI